MRKQYEFAYIYQIRNIKNNNKYIGSTVNPKKRYLWHKCSLRKNQHHSIVLQKAWEKFMIMKNQH